MPPRWRRDSNPATPLRLHVQAPGAVVQLLLDTQCRIAVIGSFPDVPRGCASAYLAGIPAAITAAPGHPLAKITGTVLRVALSKHVQLVLTDRSPLTVGRESGVMSPLPWWLADPGAKHAFLRAGPGWGSMPLHMAGRNLADGSLVPQLKAHPLLGTAFAMHAAG